MESSKTQFTTPQSFALYPNEETPASLAGSIFRSLNVSSDAPAVQTSRRVKTSDVACVLSSRVSATSPAPGTSHRFGISSRGSLTCSSEVLGSV